MASKALFAGLHIEIFTKLSNAPCNISSLMKDMPSGVTERKLTTLLTCLVSIGLLQKEGEMFANVPAAEAFLVKGAKYDFGDYLRLQIDQQMYPFMDHLTPVIKGEKSEQRFMVSRLAALTMNRWALENLVKLGTFLSPLSHRHLP